MLSFPTVQTYSNGKIVRWIGAADSEMPAPTVDITAPGGALLDVTGGDAGPPPTLPANLTGGRGGESCAGAGGHGRQEGEQRAAVVALIVGVLALLLGGGALATRRGRGVAVRRAAWRQEVRARSCARVATSQVGAALLAVDGLASFCRRCPRAASRARARRPHRPADPEWLFGWAAAVVLVVSFVGARACCGRSRG